MGNKKNSREKGNGENVKTWLDEITNTGIYYRVKRTGRGVLLTIAVTRAGLRNAPSQFVASREDVERLVASALFV